MTVLWQYQNQIAEMERKLNDIKALCLTDRAEALSEQPTPHNASLAVHILEIIDGKQDEPHPDLSIRLNVSSLLSPPRL